MRNPPQGVRIMDQGPEMYVNAGGYVRGGDGMTRPIAVDVDGNVHLSDADIMRIAAAVVAALQVANTKQAPEGDDYFEVRSNRPRPDLDY